MIEAEKIAVRTLLESADRDLSDAANSGHPKDHVRLAQERVCAAIEMLRKDEAGQPR